MTNKDALSGLSPDADEKPAIAILIAGQDADLVAGNVLRAKCQGYAPLAVHHDSSDQESLEFARELGVHTVDVSDAADTETFEQEVVRVARELGFPSVLYHSSTDKRIDIQGSLAAFERTTEYLVRTTAVPDEQLATTNVLVAIPAYNEADTIAEIVRESTQYADTVVVIDDGSTDDTTARAREAGAVVVEHQYNKGYGAALDSTFRLANAWQVESLVTIDADGQHDPADIPALIDKQGSTDADIIIGSRFKGQRQTMPLTRAIGLHIINTAANLTFRLLGCETAISDTQSGFRAYNRTAIRVIADQKIGTGMGASIYIMHFATTHGLTLAETGITIDYDVADPNTLPAFSHGRNIIRTIFHVIERDRPILALATPGLLSVLVGTGFGYWTVLKYINVGGLPIGLALLTVLFVTAGLCSMLTGVVLHSLTHRYRN